uniref:Uncharacterized protein n=1 Tax=Anguilla anguilla TaxID=7936 RepID=A0A0E9XD63_ANGAN
MPPKHFTIVKPCAAHPEPNRRFRCKVHVLLFSFSAVLEISVGVSCQLSSAARKGGMWAVADAQLHLLFLFRMDIFPSFFFRTMNRHVYTCIYQNTHFFYSC